MEKYLLDDSDENLLINDDGFRVKSQIPHGEIIWTKKTQHRNGNWGPSDDIPIFNDAGGPVLSATTIDDQSDNLEDSPLLINVS